MQLIRLEAKNVFSIGEISIDLAKKGLLLITGYSNDDNSGNGAGKSSLANHSIVWGLFGQTYDGSRGDSIINRNSGIQSGSVAITFQGVDGRVYQIIRTRNPNKLKLLGTTPHPNFVVPAVLGYPLDISHKLEKETQETINHLLGRDFASFIHSDLIGPGTERSFFRLSGPEQVSIIESLLPTTKLEEWAQTAKRRVKLLADAQEIQKRELAVCAGRKETLEQQLKNLTNENVRWRANNTSQLFSTKNLLKKVESEKKSKEDTLKGIHEEILEVRRNIPINLFVNQDPQKDKENLRDTKVTLEARVSSLTRLANVGVCNACGQDAPADKKAEAALNLANAKEELTKVNEKYIELSACVTSVSRLDNLQKQYNSISSTSYDELIGVYQKTIKECEGNTSPYEASILSCSEAIKQYEAEAQVIKNQMPIFETDLKWMEFWSKGLSTDLRTMMIEEICPFLEGRINDYLIKLRNPQFKVVVSTVKSLKSGDIREKFNLQVRSNHGADSFELLSVGEKQLVSFAASLAVADLAATQTRGKSHILILDEPFMGLHKNNCANIIEFLNSYDRSTILLISNEDELKSLVSNRVRVVKTRGVTWLE